MPVLYALAGIVLLFVILFSIRLSVIIDYSDETVVTLKYLFFKIPLVDTSKPEKEKKPKKEKKKKEKSAEEEAPAEEKAPVEEKAKPKEKTQGNSLIKQLYLDHGYDGLVKMIRAVGESLGGLFGKLYKTLVFDEFYLTMVTAGSDAADTAIKHGKLCAEIYPVLGKLVSTGKVKKYDFDISPDFLATKSKAEAYVRLHVTPIQITNAVVVLAVQLLFKVLFKILFSKKKSDKSKKVIPEALATETVGEATVENTNDKTNINKDGASL